MRYTILVVTMLLATASIMAQDKGVEDKLEARRVAYITNAIDLTSDEAQQFWPVYNDYRKEQKAMRGNEGKDSSDKENMTLSEMFSKEQSHLDLRKKYADKFQSIVGEKRTVKLLNSERRFKEGMIRGLQGRASKRGIRGRQGGGK